MLIAVSRGAEPIDVGSRRELFVDDHVIGKIEGDARLELLRPVPRDVALVPDKSWEGNTSMFYTIIRDKNSSGEDICRRVQTHFARQCASTPVVV